MYHSVGGAGPWTAVSSYPFTLNGLTLPNFKVDLPGPYNNNDYFRVRWYNAALVLFSGYYYFGPTTKLRWDVTVQPTQPTSVTENGVYNNFGVSCGCYIDVTHSLNNSLDYSNKGVKITATCLTFNGVSFSNQTVTQYYTNQWGPGVVEYNVSFGAGATTIVSVVSASAQYYVLGSPLPGILSNPANYP